MNALETVLFGLTYLGSFPAHLLVIALWTWLVSPRRGPRVGLVLAASVAANTWIKDLVGFPRPFELAELSIPELVRATAGGASWPSGHTQNTAAVWGFLALDSPFDRRGARQRLLSAAIVAMVAGTRVLLGVHFLRDVLAGLAFGLAVAVVAGFVPDRLPAWDPWGRRVLAAAALVLWWVGAPYAALGGLGSGCLLAEPGHRPPRTVAPVIGLLTGGLLGAALAYGATVALLGTIGAGAPGGLVPAGPAALLATLLALHVWPRLMVRRGWLEAADPGEPEEPTLPPDEPAPLAEGS